MNKTITTVKCKCTNEFQDKKYGLGMRIANRTEKGDVDGRDARCTVCGTLHRVPNGKFR